MRRNSIKRFISSLVIIVLFFGMLVFPMNQKHTSAATTTKDDKVEYITVRNFIKKLMVAVKVDLEEEEDPYIMAAYRSGILDDGVVDSYEKNITRAECAALLNRADEYLNGDNLEEKYIHRILEKRISDINQVDGKIRIDVAKAYGKGMIRGYSNGVGVQSREFRGNNLVTVKSAKKFIKLLLNPEERY